MSFIEKHFGGHLNIGPATFYGHNAMRFAVNISTRWGYVCFQPPIRQDGHFWPWKFYISPDATPSRSTYAAGPGIDPVEKTMSAIRRRLFGHGFSYGDDFIAWNRQLHDHLEGLYYANRRKAQEGVRADAVE